MAKNNVIEEIQELVQQIKAEYQEGVDFEIPYYSEKQKTGAIINLSPRLKSFLRKKFDFPPALNDYLDYSKTDSNGDSNYYYRLDGEHGKKGEHEGLYWRRTNKGLEQEQTKNCKSCGELTLEENGRMWLWNEKTIGKEFGQDSKVIAYFHPECAKKYFADKEQPNQNNARIKEKLLRNLDKICLDPMGELANAELLKQRGIERNYNSDNFETANDNSKPSYDIYKKWQKEVHEVEIEGEKIELGDYSATSVGSLNYQEVKEALMQEIKQNLSEWEIANYLDESSWKCDGGQLIIRNKKDGRRHWKAGFYNFWENRDKKRKEWDQIEALINGSKLPISNRNKNNDIELEKIKKIFQEHHIKKITFENGQLSIEYDNNQKAVNNSEKQTLEKYCQEHNEKKITKKSLNLASDNNSTNPKTPQWENKYLWLAGGILVGVIISLILYFGHQKKKRK